MPIKKKTASKPKSKTEKKGGVNSGSPSKSLEKGHLAAQKTSPMNITRIADDLQIKILESVFKFTDTLDNKSIKDYIRLNTNVSKVNKSFRTSYSSVRPSFKDIIKIKLKDLEITKEILEVLKMTAVNNIESIELRNISFESKKTCNEFIDFFSKNMKVKKVILDKVEVKAEELLIILVTFKGLELLEINGYELTYNEYHIFIKVLLYLKKFKYLTLKNNIIDQRYNSYLFTKEVDNVVYIDNERYKMYISKENNKRWGMVIRKDNGEMVKNIEVNIVGNEVANMYVPYINFRNDFGGV